MSDVLSQADIPRCLLSSSIVWDCISLSVGASNTSTRLKGAVRSEQGSARCSSWLESGLFREASNRLNLKILLKLHKS